MGMAAILVMWPTCHEQTSVPTTQEGSTWHLALFGQVVSEKEIFEIVNAADDGRWTPDAGEWVYYKLTYEPSAQVS